MTSLPAQRTPHTAILSPIGFDVSKPSAGFDWELIRQEIAGSIPAAASVSEYIYGCNSGAKLSTDKNYLRKASATGLVDVRSLTEVEMISEQPAGGYVITCRRINEEGEEQERYELNATHLVLAAGSLNSSRLLLKSQQAGELAAGNDRIGKAWGTNGDQLMLEFSNRPVGGAQGGPACIAALDRTDPQHPVTFMHSPASVPGNIQIQLAMSVPHSLGELTYDTQTDKSSIVWPSDSATGAAMARVNSFQRLLDFTGGSNISAAGGRPTVWHPLGGLAMGEACDYSGQLYGYENLFVVDGSLLPGSAAGVNPALTIAANAERIMEHIIPAVLARSPARS
jgi:cholesterol oxidase